MLKVVGILIVLVGLIMVVLTDRCRRKPTRCVDGFIAKRGLTRSWVALRYLHLSPEERGEMFLGNPRVRRYYLFEGYFWGIVAVVSGVGLIVQG